MSGAGNVTSLIQADKYSVSLGYTNNALVVSNIGVSITVTSGGNTVLTTTYNPIFCGGKVIGSGTIATVAANVGRVSCAVTRKGVGWWWVNYVTAYPNARYIPIVTMYNANAAAFVGSTSPTTVLDILTKMRQIRPPRQAFTSWSTNGAAKPD